MLELTRKPHTEGFVELRIVVLETQADAVAQALEWISEPTVPAEEVFRLLHLEAVCVARVTFGK